jgi:hypothetical protein
LQAHCRAIVQSFEQKVSNQIYPLLIATTWLFPSE